MEYWSTAYWSRKIGVSRFHAARMARQVKGAISVRMGASKTCWMVPQDSPKPSKDYGKEIFVGGLRYLSVSAFAKEKQLLEITVYQWVKKGRVAVIVQDGRKFIHESQPLPIFSKGKKRSKEKTYELVNAG